MAAPSADIAHHRASLARRTQSYPPDHPKVIEAKQHLVVAGLVEHVKKVVSGWPPPTPEQLGHIASLLRSAPPGSTAAKNRKTIVAERLTDLDGGADDAA